jgi:hypothetical protein
MSIKMILLLVNFCLRLIYFKENDKFTLIKYGMDSSNLFFWEKRKLAVLISTISNYLSRNDIKILERFE